MDNTVITKTNKIAPNLNDIEVILPKDPMIKTFTIQNRRYLGNKYKLLQFIEEIVNKECRNSKIFLDIFAGTGVVGASFNRPDRVVIVNDILSSSFACLNTFLATDFDYKLKLSEKIAYLNSITSKGENYISKNFGGTYFSKSNAKKIGAIREEIEKISESEVEKNILICSLLYAMDKVANTVGHYDAYRKKLDMTNPIVLLVPEIDWKINKGNKVYKQDANALVKDVECDVLYIDPPYNSRQYSDAYHLLENVTDWNKPKVTGVAKKMNRSHIKSKYCLRDATEAFADLIENARCKHILLSYNNTGESKDILSPDVS